MKTIRLHGTQVSFPQACPVCLGFPHQTFTIERTFFYGRGSMLLSLPIPLCPTHYKLAVSKSRARTWCERLSLVAGVALGLGFCVRLLQYWSASGQGSLLLNIPLAVVVGLSLAVTLWAIGYFWIAPFFASSATKSVLHSVQLRKYDPYRQVLELAFTNDTAAELTARENLSQLILAGENLKQYHISAHILDHDIRLNGDIQTQVLLDHFPVEKEALDLLQPVIDRLMVQQLGEGTFYDVDCIEIEPISA